MKKQEVIDLASRRGLCVYEQYKGRKVYYKVRIPVFEDEKEMPLYWQSLSMNPDMNLTRSETAGSQRDICRYMRNGTLTG